MSTSAMPVVSGAIASFAPRDDAPIRDRVAITLDTTRAIAVTDAGSYADALEHVKGLSALVDEIEKYFEDDVRRAFELHRSLTGKRSKAVDAVKVEIGRLKREAASWKETQDRLDRERERELALLQQRERQAQLEAEALLLERQGEPETAAAVLEEAVHAPAPVVRLPTRVPKVASVSYREDWKFEVLAPALVPREYMSPDLTRIGGVVRSLKGAAKIPGVRVWAEQTPVVRR